MADVVRVMGADVSTLCTGAVMVPCGFHVKYYDMWAEVQADTIQTWTVSRSAPESERANRLLSAYEAFAHLVRCWRPGEVAFEQYAPGAGGFAHSKGTAEITGVMKLAARQSGAEVSAAHIATARRALLNQKVPRCGDTAKWMIREFLMDHGAPPSFRSLDICDAMAVADHRLGVLGFPRLGRGPLETVKAAKKRAR